MAKKRLKPMNLNDAVKNMDGKPITAAGRECRDLIKSYEDCIEADPFFSEGKQITIDEASELLGVSQQTLRNWEKEGKIEAERTSGGHRRYNKAKINELRKKQMSPAEIIIPSVDKSYLSSMFEEMFARFLDDEKFNFIIKHDQITNKVAFIFDSIENICTAIKVFEEEK